MGEEIPKDLFHHMFEILNAQIMDDESHFNNLLSEAVFSRDKYLYKKKLKRASNMNHKWKRRLQNMSREKDYKMRCKKID